MDVRFKGDADRRAQLYINSVGRCYKDVGQVAVLYLIDTTDQKNLELQFIDQKFMILIKCMFLHMDGVQQEIIYNHLQTSSK